MDMIAAVTSDWGIGKNGDLLYSIPNDMKFFRMTTAESTVIMGRKTLESFPNKKPLPKRKNIILTNDKKFTCVDAFVVHSVEEALEISSNDEKVFVIGGESIYRAFLPYCKYAYITKMEITPDADTFFPNLDTLDEWRQISAGEPLEHEGVKYRFTKYENITIE